MKTTHIAVGAMAIALAFAPLAKLQAASLLTPDSRLEIGGLAEVVTAKVGKSKLGKKKHMRKHARRKGARQARSRGGPGRCGENMYWSGKAHKCMDARDKA
jgi:hypothetical protein